MRLHPRPSLLLAVLVLLALPVAAAADIKPIPRPDNPPAKTPAKTPIAPTKPPVTHTQTNTGSTGTGSTGTGSTGTATTGTTTGSTSTNTGTTGATGTHAPEVVVVKNVEGGRDQSHVAVPLPPPPDPTPLTLVGSSEVVPSQGSGTPIWKVALLALLAAGEAFVIVRLVRRRPAALSPAQ